MRAAKRLNLRHGSQANDDRRSRSCRRAAARGGCLRGTRPPPDIDPATAASEEDDESRLPDLPEEGADTVAEGPLAAGHAAIEHAVRLPPTSPGVYRMLNAANDVLYVGKAKNVRKRLASYARASAPQPARILRMIAATVDVEIISTATETEALLLEANLIKQLRPRFNVQLRDDKSFPYILITGDHWAPQILKHRGAQTRPGQYFGPFASAGAVNRTITALQRAFLVRSCTDGFFESRTRPCLLYQIRRCSGPCTGEIDFPGYTELVREAKDFLSGRSRGGEAGTGRRNGKGRGRARIRNRGALPRPPRGAVGDPVAARHQSAHAWRKPTCSPSTRRAAIPASRCSSSAPDRTGATAPIFRARRNPSPPEEVLASFLAQFYDDKPPPKLILLSHEIEESELLADALSIKAGFKVEVSTPAARREEGIDHARADQRARGAGPQARRYRDPGPAAAGAGRRRSACRIRRSGSRSTTTATSRAPTRSAP